MGPIRRKKTPPCGRKVPTLEKRSLALLSELQNKLDIFCKESKLNVSSIRNQILSVIAEQISHFSAASLIHEVALRFPHIGPATVYRNLPIFLKAGILRETLTSKSGETLYELQIKPHHDHIVCLDCGEIFEFQNEEIEEAQIQVTQSMDFDLKNHWHVIYGQCILLRRQMKRKNK